jgi:hypothetical protein
MKGLEKIASMTGTTRLLQRHPRIIFTPIFHYVWTSLNHTTSYYMAWMISFGNFPFLVDASPMGHFVFFFSFV